MSTYLLTWNPAKWLWDDLAECIHQVRATGHCLDRWGCGNNRRIVEGDRLFLIRIGKEPRGIVGSGWAVSSVFDDWHRDDAKRANGQRTWYVQIDFDALLNAELGPILSRAQLNSGMLGAMRWNSRVSGIMIPDEVVQHLESEWARFLTSQVAARMHVRS
jgi:5-methylcytosine-specific restriction protein A